MGYVIVLVALFGLMWFLLIRPQRRRTQTQMVMQDQLRAGDEIITAGGLHGYVRQLDEEVLTIEIAPDVRVRVDRRAVAGVVQTDEPEAEAEEEVEEPEELEPEQPEEPKRVTQAGRSES